jgi:type VI secretion system protein ImpL
VQSAVQVSDKPADLDSLRPLEKAIRSLEQPAGGSHWFGALGLDRSANLLPSLNQLLIRRAVPLLRESAFRATEDRLRAYSSRDSSSAARAAAYNDLRAYLLLGADVGRLRTSADDQAFLKEYLRHTAESRPGDSVYTNRVVTQLQTAVMKTDSGLVDRMRQVLYTPPTVDGLYRGLRDEGTRRLPAVTMVRLIGATHAAVFAPGAQISGLYTKGGWESFVQAAIEDRSHEPTRANWVLGSKVDRLPAELSNTDSLAGRLLGLYFRDYAAEWKRFLVGLHYAQGDRSAVIRQLDVLQDPEKSPLVVLLDSVAAETRFDNPAKKKANAFISSTLKKFGYEAQSESVGASSNPVDRAFAPVHAIRGPALGQILSQYQDASSKLQASGEGSPSASSTEQLSRELQTARINISRTAKALDSDIRDAVFNQPLDIARAALKNTVGGALIGQWHSQVCGPFQDRLAGKYPFSKRATTAASLLDVERYFRPQGGTVWTFYERELSEYLRSGDFQAKGNANIPQSISGSLRRARSISDGLFDGSGAIHLDFDLIPQPPSVEMLTEEPTSAAPTVTQVAMTIDGQDAVYQMGRQNPKSFAWPNAKADERGASIAVTVARVGQSALRLPVKEARGDWGWLHLVDSASVSPMPGGNVRLDWAVSDAQGRFAVHVAYVLHARSGQSLFNSPREFFQFECGQ